MTTKPRVRYHIRTGRRTVAFAVLWLTCAAAVAGLSPQEQRGKQIYVQGTSPSDAAITAMVGKEAVTLPASTVPCASCHGPDGRGRPEGGVTPSDITWRNLTKSYGHQHAFGRHHPAFDAASLAAAITRGIDPAGNRLDAAMPRYRMEPEDLQALITYLERIETDSDRGVSASRVRLATQLPLTGRLASLGEAMRAVMAAYFADLNAAGGIHGRDIELLVIPFGDSPRAALSNLEQSLAEQEIFALVGTYSVGLESEMAQLMEQQQTPLVGPFTLQPHSGAALDLHTFYLFPGHEQQARVLVDYALGLAEQAPRLAVVGPATPYTARLGEVIRDQALSHGLKTVQVFDYPDGALPAAQLAADLRDAASTGVFFFGTPDELTVVLQALGAMSQPPAIFLPSTLVTPTLFRAPAVFEKRIFIAYPTLPSDLNPMGRRDYNALRAKHDLPSEHVSGQIAAYAAARTLVEGLKRAGRDLSREKLVSALEGLYRFDTGLTAPLTYNPNRRIGALGAHVVAVQLEAGRYAPVGPWRTLE